MDSNSDDLFSASNVANQIMSMRLDQDNGVEFWIDNRDITFGGRMPIDGNDVVNTLNVVQELMRGTGKPSSPSPVRGRGKRDNVEAMDADENTRDVGEKRRKTKEDTLDGMDSDFDYLINNENQLQPGVNIVRKGIKKTAFGARGKDNSGLTYRQTGHQVRGGIRGQTMLSWTKSKPNKSPPESRLNRGQTTLSWK